MDVSQYTSSDFQDGHNLRQRPKTAQHTQRKWMVSGGVGRGRKDTQRLQRYVVRRPSIYGAGILVHQGRDAGVLAQGSVAVGQAMVRNKFGHSAILRHSASPPIGMGRWLTDGGMRDF